MAHRAWSTVQSERHAPGSMRFAENLKHYHQKKNGKILS
jgi:hypothetical protein